MRSLPIAPAGGGSGETTLELAKRFESISDFFLTDTLIVRSGSACNPAQPVDGFVGITGKTCDWDVAANLVSKTTLPVILAGGLSPENVTAAIEAVRPAGVDSCTRTNALDQNGRPIRFKKDAERVRRFVEAACAAAC
jgi:phosphoribosylanthranilate isomerase